MNLNNNMKMGLLILAAVVVGLVILNRFNLVPVDLPFLKKNDKAEGFKAFGSKAECIRALGDASECSDY